MSATSELRGVSETGGWTYFSGEFYARGWLEDRLYVFFPHDHFLEKDCSSLSSQPGASICCYNQLIGKILVVLGYASEISLGDKKVVYVNTQSLFKYIIRRVESRLHMMDGSLDVDKMESLYRQNAYPSDALMKAVRNVFQQILVNENDYLIHFEAKVHELIYDPLNSNFDSRTCDEIITFAKNHGTRTAYIVGLRRLEEMQTLKWKDETLNAQITLAKNFPGRNGNMVAAQYLYQKAEKMKASEEEEKKDVFFEALTLIHPQYRREEGPNSEFELGLDALVNNLHLPVDLTSL